VVAGSRIALKRLTRDGQFWAALLAAPVFWVVLWLFKSPRPEWGWPLLLPAQFLLLVVVYPLLEELVFRGALQGWLRARGWGATELGVVTVANVISSAVFTLTHLLVNPVYLSAAVFLPSLVFGYFRDRYDQLRASIALHIFYNAGYIWVFAGIPTS
jgi:membrane protease YdiL (CAAX protease family)